MDVALLHLHPHPVTDMYTAHSAYLLNQKRAASHLMFVFCPFPTPTVYYSLQLLHLANITSCFFSFFLTVITQKHDLQLENINTMLQNMISVIV